MFVKIVINLLKRDISDGVQKQSCGYFRKNFPSLLPFRAVYVRSASKCIQTATEDTDVVGFGIWNASGQRVFILSSLSLSRSTYISIDNSLLFLVGDNQVFFFCLVGIMLIGMINVCRRSFSDSPRTLLVEYFVLLILYNGYSQIKITFIYLLVVDYFIRIVYSNEWEGIPFVYNMEFSMDDKQSLFEIQTCVCISAIVYFNRNLNRFELPKKLKKICTSTIYKRISE